MKITEPNNIQGFTLVEVMVAMLITFIVMGGAYQTMTRETIEMERQEIILDMQNNARAAIDRIASEIRQSGFFGCGGDLDVNLLKNAGDNDTQVGVLTSATSADADGNVWNGGSSILTTLRAMSDGAGIDYLGTPLAFNGDAAASHDLYGEGTDALSLVYLAGDVRLDPAMTDEKTNPLTLATKAFASEDIIYLTDCKDYSIFQKTNSNDTLTLEYAQELLNNSNELGKAYGVDEQAWLYSLKISTFFIGKGDNANELIFNNTGRTIASNIEDLQFQFLTDTDNDDELDDEDWFNTFDPGKPEAVRAIRVWILARSEVVSSYTNKETYSYAGKAPYTPNDHRYRYLTNVTVYLRNAGINNSV